MTREEWVKKIADYELGVEDIDSLLITESQQLMFWSTQGLVLFSLQEDGTFDEKRPEVYPIGRITKISYEKKLIGSDQLQLEVEGDEMKFLLPHRSKRSSDQREELKKLRESLSTK